MGSPVAALVPKEPRDGDGVVPAVILNALPSPVIVLGPRGDIRFVNLAGEQFFGGSDAYLRGRALDDLIPGDSPLFALIEQVRGSGSSVVEYGITLESPRIGSRFVTIQVAPMPDLADCVVVTLLEQSIARRIDHQLTHRHAARSITAMAAMLAHEIKNPLSGIRGAAQLIESDLADGGRDLTRLICDETDRICALVDRMEVFSDQRPIERAPVNIHRVLEHARRVAENGFARGIRFIEEYDPSLPAVSANRDQLVQIFLNLIKNAAEAAPPAGGEIRLRTAYQHGVRLAVPGRDARVHLPLLVSITDNGDGIPEDVRAHLFDPFITTKASGSGLGLALVAKIINDHGGVIDFASEPGRTMFRVMLPVDPAGGDDR